MQRLPVYPPHPEEGASTCAFEKLTHRVGARLEGWGGPWFETPRTRLRNLDGPEIVAPHHEAERNHVCIKLIGIRFGAVNLRFLSCGKLV
jgi:hypothetical protein